MTDQDYVVPQWLDKAYLEHILWQKSGTKNLKVDKFSVKVATKKGENYASEMFRIEVKTILGEDLSLILKKPHSEKDKRSIVDAYNFFGREIKLYTEYLPQIYKILESVGEFEGLAPDLIYCDQERETLILDDLRPRGYVTGDRENRLCRESGCVFMRKLGKYHAASIILNTKLDGKLAEFPFDQFIADGPFREYMELHPYALVEEVESWGPEFEHFLPKLRKIAKDFRQIAHEATISKRGLNVLVHGDPWYTNLLIKKSGDTVDDVRMIDFQLNSWASLATDLLYFIFRSLNEEDYENGFDYLLQIYHRHFAAVLSKANYDRVASLEDITGEVRDRFFHAFYCVMMCKPFADAATEEDAVLEALTDRGMFGFRKKFQSPRINREMRFVLKWLDREGALDL